MHSSRRDATCGHDRDLVAHLAARFLHEQELGERATRSLMLADILATTVILGGGVWLWHWSAPPPALVAAVGWPLSLALAFAARRLAWIEE